MTMTISNITNISIIDNHYDITTSDAHGFVTINIPITIVFNDVTKEFDAVLEM